MGAGKCIRATCRHTLYGEPFDAKKIGGFLNIGRPVKKPVTAFRIRAPNSGAIKGEHANMSASCCAVEHQRFEP